MNMTHHPRLLEVVRQRIRVKHYSHRTEKAYVHRIWRFILFYGRRHPRGLGRCVFGSFDGLASVAPPLNGGKHSR